MPLDRSSCAMVPIAAVLDDTWQRLGTEARLSSSLPVRSRQHTTGVTRARAGARGHIDS